MVFSLFNRKELDVPLSTPSLLDSSCIDASTQTPQDPAEQVELVHQAVLKLNEVRRLVRALPEVPVGDRQTLINQLASTSDSLRSLYFLDAIY